MCLLIVRINATTTEDGFTGFILQARDKAGVVQGVFDVEGTSSAGADVQTLDCVTDNDTVTHSKDDVKQSVDLVWNAPLNQCSANDVYFR